MKEYTTMALVIKKIVDYYFYLNDEISGELKVLIIKLILNTLHDYNGYWQHISGQCESIFHYISDNFFFLFCLHFYVFRNSVSDPRVRDMLFMSNPFKVIGILAIYLCFILKWGPEFMKNRKPFNINKLIIVYNIIQIVACARLVMQVIVILSFLSNEFVIIYPHYSRKFQ